MNKFARLLVATLPLSMLTACDGPAPTSDSSTATAGVMSRSSRAEQSIPAPAELALPGERANYTLSGGVLTSKSTGLLTTIPADTQRLRFTDGVLALDTDGAAGTMYRLYQAAFDRVPDAAGYAYWLANHDKGTPLQAIAQGFVGSQEFATLYGQQPSNAQLLTRYYQNVLHRAPDPAGYDWWLNTLNAGHGNAVSTLMAFSDSPENRALVAPAIANGIWMPSSDTWTAAVIGDTANIRAGRVLAIELKGVGAASVSATLNGRTLASEVIDGHLVVQLPLNTSGSMDLALADGKRTVRLSLTISPAVSIADPLSYMTSTYAALDTQLAAVMASASGTDLANLQAMRTALQAEAKSLGSASPAILAEAAQLHAANAGAPTLSKSSLSATECAAAAQNYPFVSATTIAAAAATAFAIHSKQLYLIVPAAALTVILVKTQQTAVSQLADKCLSFTALGFGTEEMSSSSNFLSRSSAQQASVTYNWRHRAARRFRLVETRSLPEAIGFDAELQSKRVAGMLSKLNAYTSLVGVDFGPAIATLNNFTRVQTRAAQPGDYALGTVSDGRIEGTAAASGQAMSLQFAFRSGQMPAAAAPFTFTLVNRAEGKASAPFDSTLSPVPLPTVQPVTIVGLPGQQTNGKLIGENADRFELVTRPTKGSATLANAATGTFTYTLNTGANGDDSFTYRAVNDAGVSTVATVTVKTDLKSIYEQAVLGTWTVNNMDGGSVVHTYTLTIEPGGVGYYTAGETRYRISWSINRNIRNEYTFVETGFWHPGYDSGFVEALSYPVTQHYTYNFQYRPPTGQAPDPAQRARLYRKN